MWSVEYMDTQSRDDILCCVIEALLIELIFKFARELLAFGLCFICLSFINQIETLLSYFVFGNTFLTAVTHCFSCCLLFLSWFF